MHSPDEVLLRVKNLSKTFTSAQKSPYTESPDGSFRLTNVSFELNRGESLCVIGLNGSGKSTLLKILSGISVPDDGYAEVRGSSLSVLDIGTGFHPDLTGYENIEMVLGLQQIHKSDFPKTIAQITSFSELEGHLGVPLKYYSSGMYLRLAMAIMFSIDVDLMIVDEVVSVGDINFQQKCTKALIEKAKAGASIVLATHDLRLTEAICNKCIWLNNGNVVLCDNTQVVINSFLNKQYSFAQTEVESIGFGKQEAKTNDKSKVLRLLQCNVRAADKSKKINELTGVEIEFIVEKKIEGQLSMGLVICDKLRSPIIGLTPLRTTKRGENENLTGSGMFICSVKVPPYFLNRNLFTLALFLEDEKGETVFKETISSFVVEHVDHNYNGSSYVYKGEFNGPLYMPLDWVITKKN